jgi:hypothetical protein
MNHFTIRVDTKHRITVTYMLEGRVKTITVRIDTKYCIAVAFDFTLPSNMLPLYGVLYLCGW